MGHQEEHQVPTAVPRVPLVVPGVAMRTDGLKAAVRKAGPATGLAGLPGLASKGDGEPPKGEPPKADPPKGEAPPKGDPPKADPPKDPPKDPKLGRLGRLDRVSRVLADPGLAVPQKGHQGLAEGVLSRPDRLNRP